MSPWSLILDSAILLAFPLLFQFQARPEDWEFRGFLAFLWSLNSAYCELVHRLQSESVPLPATGPAILIANHTCNIDHFLLQAATGRKLGFMIARSYYEVPAFRPFCEMIDCIPVNGNGHDMAATRSALRALKQGRVLPIFPEGRILPTSGEEIGEGQPGVAFLAMRANVPIIPAYIRGTPRSNVFIKSLLTASNSRIIYGPPIVLADCVNSDDHESERTFRLAATEKLMAAIRALRDQSHRDDQDDDS